MLIALVLGVLQGVTEWLPVSSEGVIVTTYTTVWNRPFDETVATALWLHLGTMVAAVVAFRGDIVHVGRRCLASGPAHNRVRFRVMMPVVLSGIIGLPLLLALGGLSTESGAVVMALVGGAMLITGWMQLRRKTLNGERGRGELNTRDGLALGVAQGLAVVPGLSRSGLTVAVLLARNMNRRDALVISFLMGIPASIGAAGYVALTDGLELNAEAFAALGIAAVVGLATIHVLLSVVRRINFGALVILVGGVILLSALVQISLASDVL